MPTGRRPRLTQDRRRTLRARTAAHLALSFVLLTAALGVVQSVSAAGNSVRIEPAVQTVAQDATFSAQVIQHADVPTSGVAASITFDPTLVQIQSVTRAGAYAEAAIFNGASQIAITAANLTGSLVGVAAALLAPDAVPAGDAVFIDITFKAIGCGTVALGLPTGVTDAAMLDGRPETYGNTLSVATIGASVALCNSVRIEPAVQTVAQDATFSAQVIQHADVPTSGVAASITFDPTLVQIQSVTRAGAYAEAAIFNGAGQIAITAANLTGSLVGVAAALLAPDAVPAGDAVFIDITFKAIGCGTVALGLPTGVTDAAMLDGRPETYGNTLSVATIGASVETCVVRSPTPSGSPGSSASPGPSGSSSPSPSASATPSPSPTPVPGDSIRIEPATTRVARDATFSVRVVHRSDVATGGITATLVFDPALLQVVSITASSAYATANLRQSASADAIAAANTSGVLKSVKAEFATREQVPAGEADFITVEFRAVACGRTPLLMPNEADDSSLLDGRETTYGNSLPIRTVKGVVQVCDTQVPATPTPPSGNSIRLESFYTGVVENGGFTVRVVQRADVPTGGITATLIFDPAILQVVSITRSPAFVAAPFFQGASASAIKAANASGRLKQVSAAFLSPGSVPVGEADFISVEFKAIACGETPLFVPNTPADSALTDGRPDTYGKVLPIKTVKGVVQACDPEAKPTPRPTATPKPAATPRPTRVPTPPPAPVAPVIPPDPGITLPPTGGEPPVDVPSPEPVAEPAPAASPTAAAVLVASTRSASPTPGSSAMSRVALVGLGVGGMIAGLMVVMAVAFVMLAGLIAPVVITRLVRRR